MWPFTVGPMSEAELRLAVTGPAAEADLIVEPAVVDAVIEELREGARGGLGTQGGRGRGETAPEDGRGRYYAAARRSS